MPRRDPIDSRAKAMLVDYLILVLSALLGSVSLLGFGLVLALGPFENVPLRLTTPAALAWDAGLCLVFFVQHSGMIRRPFRERLGRSLSPHLLPAVYSIASGGALLLLIVLWQRTPLLHSVEGALRWALRGAFVLGGVGFLWAVHALRSFDTFGLEPIWAHRRGAEPRTLPLAIRGPYRWVRHPLYSLFLVFLWTCPDVTADRVLFNALFAAWLVLGSILEERDLVRSFGEPYRAYQRRVPMLVPWKRPSPSWNGASR
jgi:protein-S-isoprenylcysteine O-methyltransferase Ste14